MIIFLNRKFLSALLILFIIRLSSQEIQNSNNILSLREICIKNITQQIACANNIGFALHTLEKTGLLSNQNKIDILQSDFEGKTILHHAVLQNNPDAVEKTINIFKNSVKRNFAFDRQLRNMTSNEYLKAIGESQDIDLNDLAIDSLVKNYVNNLSQDGKTPLYRAVIKINTIFNNMIINTLVQNGADVNTYINGKPILFHALNNYQNGLADKLIAHGADINALSAFEEREANSRDHKNLALLPLYMALANKKQAYNHLLKQKNIVLWQAIFVTQIHNSRNVDIQERQRDGWRIYNDNITKAIPIDPEYITLISPFGYSPIEYSIMSVDFANYDIPIQDNSFLPTMIEKIEYQEQRDNVRGEALVLAIELNDLNAIDQLTANEKLDEELITLHGRICPVELTVVMMKPKMLNHLLKTRKASIPNNPIKPLLIRACENLARAQKTAENICKLLIAHNAPVNIPDENGNSPLHYASRNGSLPILYDLIYAQEIDINALNKDNQTPYDVANSQRIRNLLTIYSGRPGDEAAYIRDHLRPRKKRTEKDPLSL